MDSVKIYTAYNPPKQEAIIFEEDTLTQQHFADEADINKIVARAQRIGGLPPNLKKGLYGDFTNIASYQEAHAAVEAAQAAFAALPSAVRERFRNDPSQLIQFLSDSSNKAEAEKLGLIEPSAPVPDPKAAEKPVKEE